MAGGGPEKPAQSAPDATAVSSVGFDRKNQRGARLEALPHNCRLSKVYRRAKLGEPQIGGEVR